MGAFFLYQNNCSIDPASVEYIFKRKGFSKPEIFRLGRYTLWLYQKILTESKNYFIHGSNSIFSVGTLIYKKCDNEDSLKRILYDFETDQFSVDDIIGNYCIIIKLGDRIKFFIDRAGIYNVYYNQEKSMISSSFLALLYASPRRFKVNKLAILEMLLSGGLIGPDTPVSGLFRLELRNLYTFNDLEFVNQNKNDIILSCDSSFDACVDEQINILNEYFMSVKNIADKYGSIIGLTGGFDSRLLLSMAEKHFKNVGCYSHWRKVESIELKVARKLANKLAKNLRVVEVKAPLDMSEEESYNCLEDAFYYNDGFFRIDSYWHESYNTRKYQESLFTERKLGLNGIGGEQYRNVERMVWPFWLYPSWLKYEVIYKKSRNIFSDKHTGKEFYEHVDHKIRTKLNLARIRIIDHLTVKRYLNEIYNVSIRTHRTNIENQLTFFLSPFTDYSVSHKSYRVLKKLGPSFRFEAAMIKKINPGLAKIVSDYGYHFNNRIPLRENIISLGKELVPKSVFHLLNNKAKNSFNDPFYNYYKHRFNFMSGFDKNIEDLSLGINMKQVKHIKYINALLISLGYFLHNLQEKIVYS